MGDVDSDLRKVIERFTKSCAFHRPRSIVRFRPRCHALCPVSMLGLMVKEATGSGDERNQDAPSQSELLDKSATSTMRPRAIKTLNLDGDLSTDI